MNAFQGKRSTGETEASIDLSWRGLYWAGGVSAALYVILVVVPVVLVFTVPQPPTSGGAATLEYIASHKVVYLTELVSFVGLSVPALVVFLALYPALKHLSKSYAALGALLGIASEVAALAYNSSPPSLSGDLLFLSDHYMATPTPAQQAALATAAEGLIAVANAVAGAGILTALGILILSLVMLKGVFPKGVAIVGIATGALGIVSESLRDVIGLGYVLYGLLLPTWFLAVGWKLSRLAASNSHVSAAKKLEAEAAP